MSGLGGLITKLGQNIVLITIVLIIAGCKGTSSINKVPLLSNKDVADTTKGVVVARLIVTSSQRYPFNEMNLIPKDFNESQGNKVQSVRAIPAQNGHSVIFAGAVKPGSYSLGSMNSFYQSGSYFYINAVKAGLSFGTFTVEANTVTDLGTIIYYPKSQEDSAIQTLIRVPTQAPGALVEQFFPFYQYDPLQVLSWDEDGFADERESSYLSAAQNPVSFYREYLADDGYLYFLAPLGFIVIRTPDGEWLTDAIDTNLPIRAIAKSVTGDLIVGGDEGKVFIKRSGGDVWEDISIEQVFDVQEVAFDDTNNLLVFASKAAHMGLFKSKENMAGMAPNWQVPLYFDSRTGWNKNDGNRTDWQRSYKQDRIMNARLNRSGDELSFYVYHQTFRDNFVTGSPESSRYIANLNDLSFKRAKKKSGIDFVIDAGVRQIGVDTSGFFSWEGNPSLYMKNEQSGKWDSTSEWVQRPNTVGAKKQAFKFTSAPWFGESEHGVAVTLISYDKKPKIMHSTDGGIKWIKTDYEVPQASCINIISVIKDRILLSCNGSSDFYESMDNGKTWLQVREHEQL